jgi:hypothetical protein
VLLRRLVGAGRCRLVRPGVLLVVRGPPPRVGVELRRGVLVDQAELVGEPLVRRARWLGFTGEPAFRASDLRSVAADTEAIVHVHAGDGVHPGTGGVRLVVLCGVGGPGRCDAVLRGLGRDLAVDRVHLLVRQLRDG